VFSADFIHGESSSVLDEPGSVVLTRRTAEKLFGTADAVGRSLTINDEPMAVSGVVENPETPSHLPYDYVVSIMTMPTENREQLDGLWFNIGMWSYVVLPADTDPMQVEAQMAEVYETRAGARGRGAGIQFEFHLQPLRDIHLHSNLDAEYGVNGDINYVYAFSIIAVFILLIACVNFANLSTARSTTRAREVGVRKAVGAHQSNLVARFLTESFVTATLSLLLAVLLVWAALGWFNGVTSKEMSLVSLATGPMITAALALLAVCSLLAGLYPAFVLSAFRPVQVLRGQISSLGSKSTTRRALVVMQFSVSIVLMVGTLVIRNQVEYMKNKPLGFDKDALAVLTMDTGNDFATWESFRETLLGQSTIRSASFASGVPGQVGELRLFVPDGRDSTETFPASVARVDHDFLATYDMRLSEGRFYDPAFTADTVESFVINEAAARMFGWSGDAVGKRLEFRGVRDSRVVGVVKDFHFRPLTEEIAPLVMILSTRPWRLLTLRFERGAEVAGMESVKEAWAAFEPTRPLNIQFLDEDLASRYAAQETAGRLVTTFALLAIMIAALGLFGLASFSVQRRTKEIGVRKVLGATMGQIVVLVNREFTGLLLVAIVVACPVAYLLLSRYWLDQFPYRIDLGLIPFVNAAVLGFVVIVVATLYHAVSAAKADPVASLRYE
jgi:putative ABC transport system permease protein